MNKVVATNGRGAKLHVAYTDGKFTYLACDTNSNKNAIRLHKSLGLESVTCTKCKTHHI